MTRGKNSEETDQKTINFLLGKTKKIVFIGNPFPTSPFKETLMESYENGRLTRDERVPTWKGPEILQYLNHILMTYLLLLKVGLRYDLCIAHENLSFFILYPLRLLGMIKRLVYYSVDYVPQRFSNQLLNKIYHFLDRFACKHSDLNWVMVKEQIKIRRKNSITKKDSSPFALASVGYNFKLIKIKSVDKIDFYNIIFAGALLENSGPQLGILALPYLLKKFPKIYYTIIGKGIYENELKKLIKKLKVEKFVKFTGYIDSFKKMSQIISKGSIGLAPFVPNPNSLSFYSDPSKIKLYLACGLPVITTNVTTIAPLIRASRSGEIINFSEKDLAKTIVKMLSSKEKYESYKKAAVKLSEGYDINNILKKAFERIPD
ncbi:MAG: glycosyltransferase [Candidatus Daviesbacteria bacterium]|nr:glycosyltransferase [Candidatus Daviesbacteria bacterium]